MGAIYRRIVVKGRDFPGVELTEKAKAMGLAVALAQGWSARADRRKRGDS